MNDNLSRAGLTLLIIISVVLSVAYIKHLADQEPQIIYIQDPNYVQNIGEAQKRLKEQGFYNGKIDYLWQGKTEKAYCDWCAAQTFKPEYYEAIEGE